jgi:hypothetical protein
MEGATEEAAKGPRGRALGAPRATHTRARAQQKKQTNRRQPLAAREQQPSIIMGRELVHTHMTRAVTRETDFQRVAPAKRTHNTNKRPTTPPLAPPHRWRRCGRKQQQQQQCRPPASSFPSTIAPPPQSPRPRHPLALRPRNQPTNQKPAWGGGAQRRLRRRAGALPLAFGAPPSSRPLPPPLPLGPTWGWPTCVHTRNPPLLSGDTTTTTTPSKTKNRARART